MMHTNSKISGSGNTISGSGNTISGSGNTISGASTPTYQLPKDLRLETPFWKFSLALWKDQAAQRALLSLQNNMNLIVNRLLFCNWLGFERRELLTEAMFQDPLIAQWHEQSVTTLRTLRNTLKIAAPLQPLLIASVQNAELQAEQIEQALLFQRVDQLSQDTTKRNTLETLSFNLLSYTQRAVNESGQDFQTDQIYPHLITLIQAVIPNHDRSHIEAYFH
jgi:uncharacterized protein (TIGR02444 family)